MFSFKENKVDLLHPVGRGASGTIYPYKESENDTKKWVVKELKTTIENLKYIVQEIVFGFNHDHPFILHIAGYHLKDCGDGDIKMYLRMPRMKKSLGDLISNNQYQQDKLILPKETVVKWFYSLANALAYLKRKNIAHSDIKPENILLDDNDNAYLSDLGLSKFAGADVTAYLSCIAGTPKYMAPEYGSTEFKLSLRDDPAQLYPADVWSLGMTILDICSDQSKNIHYPEKIEEIGRNESIIKKDIEVKLQQVEKRYGVDFKEILSQLLIFKPSDRITYEKICEVLQEKFKPLLEGTINILGDKIASLFGPDLPTKRNSNQLATSLQKLADNLKENFNFTFNNEFSIELKEPLNITSKTLEGSIQNIVKTIKSDISSLLGSITLNFAYCDNLTPDALKSLRFDMPQFERVQSLDLNFAGCEKIINREGKLPFHPTCFKGLSGLRCLKLNFAGCINFTNSNLDDLLNIISNSLLKLETLSLDFSECPEIIFQGEHIDNLKKYLNKLKFLKELSINSINCEKITIPMKKHLRKELSEIKNLVPDLRL